MVRIMGVLFRRRDGKPLFEGSQRPSRSMPRRTRKALHRRDGGSSTEGSQRAFWSMMEWSVKGCVLMAALAVALMLAFVAVLMFALAFAVT